MLSTRFKTILLSSTIAFSSSFTNAAIFDDYMLDPDDGQLDASRYISEVPLGFLPVPQIITEPAVGTGLAVAGVFFHDTDENKHKQASDTPMLPNSISIIGAGFTENGSKLLGGGHVSYWQQDTLRYRGFAGFGDLNLDFYTLGDLTLTHPVELNLKGPAIVQTLSKRLPNSNWFIGAKQLYRHVSISFAHSPTSSMDGLLAQEITKLTEQFELQRDTSGLGLVANYDSLNNPINPATGYNYAFEHLIFDESIGSDIDYSSSQITALNYWQLNEKYGLALRLQYDKVNAKGDNELPVYVLPFVDMRGIPKSRYQGTDVFTSELEGTYHINRRWKVNAFTGLGKAANSWSDLSDSSSRTSVGAGFRYLIAKRYGFTMGLDIAKGPEDTAVYIQAGSTW